MSELKEISETRSPSPVSQIRTRSSRGKMTHPTTHRDRDDRRAQIVSLPVLFSYFFVQSPQYLALCWPQDLSICSIVLAGWTRNKILYVQITLSNRTKDLKNAHFL